MPEQPADLAGEWAFKRGVDNDVRVVRLFQDEGHRQRWLMPFRGERVLGYAIMVNDQHVYVGQAADFHPDVHNIHNLGRWRGATGLAEALVAEARGRGFRASLSTWDGIYLPPKHWPGRVFEMLGRCVQIRDEKSPLEVGRTRYLTNVNALYVVKIDDSGRCRRISW